MEATLLITEVVLVVVLGGTFSSAKTFNSLERNENSAFENEDRVRRDFQTFQSQIESATSLSLGVDCSPSLCTSNLSLDLCSAFCQTNTAAYKQVITSLANCYMGELCGRNLSSIALTNVNISLGVPSYDGQCTLYGSNVTMTLANVVPDVLDLDFPTIAGYNLYSLLPYTFEGLSVRCQPCAPPPQTANQSVSTAAAYENRVSVTLNIYFQPVFIYSPGTTPFQTSGYSSSQAQVIFGDGVGGGGIPSDYQTQVQLGIQNVFTNNGLYQDTLIYNYHNIIYRFLRDFRDDKCPSTCNAAG